METFDGVTAFDLRNMGFGTDVVATDMHCPVCGSDMVKIVSPNITDQYIICQECEHAVEYNESE